MKAIFLMCALVVAVNARPDEEHYTNKYDHLDFEQIVKTDKLFINYFNCLMETGRCTAEAQELKDKLPDALEHDCAKCTPKQKEGFGVVFKYLINERPEQWKQLCDKFDPERKYTPKYEQEYKKSK